MAGAFIVCVCVLASFLSLLYAFEKHSQNCRLHSRPFHQIHIIWKVFFWKCNHCRYWRCCCWSPSLSWIASSSPPPRSELYHHCSTVAVAVAVTVFVILPLFFRDDEVFKCVKSSLSILYHIKIKANSELLRQIVWRCFFIYSFIFVKPFLQLQCCEWLQSGIQHCKIAIDFMLTLDCVFLTFDCSAQRDLHGISYGCVRDAKRKVMASLLTIATLYYDQRLLVIPKTIWMIPFLWC